MTRSLIVNEAWLTEDQSVDHESLIPQYVQLAAILRAKIVAWGLPAGTIGPAEAQLAEKYGVSRATARKAYRLLDELGYTDSRDGRGHLVARDSQTTTLTPGPNSTII